MKIIRSLNNAASAFRNGWCDSRCASVTNRDDKQLREDLSEKQVDRMVEDSFPASDPPSTY